MKKSIVYYLSLIAIGAAPFFISLTAHTKPLDRDKKVPGKCATFFTTKEKIGIAKVFDVDQANRPICQAQYRSSNKIFRIHFDTSGVHSVDLADLNVNGVPDYIDSVAYYFEYVALKYNEFGMPSPYPDDGLGGDSCFDVYLKNIGDGDLYPMEDFDQGGVYGWAERAAEIGNFTPKKFKSFIIMDNDYSEKDSVRNEPGPGETQGKAVRQAYKEFGVLGMKITAAHEYSHAVQFLYGIEPLTGSLLAEMTSVFMEYTLFPESRDHKQYVNNLMKYPDEYPFGNPGADQGYRYCIFLDYVTAKYGEKSIPRIWEYMSQNNPVYKSLDLFFHSENTSLDSAWMNFMPWVYYTGSRAKPGYLPHATEYAELNIRKNIFFDKNEAYEYESQIKPFEISLIRYYFNRGVEFTDDTLDIVASNPDINSVNSYSYDRFNGFSTAITANGSPNDINERVVEIFSYDPPKYFSFISDYEFGNFRKFESPGMKVEVFTGSYPSPLQLKKDPLVYFPAPEKTAPFTTCNLIIRDIAGATLYSKDYKSGIYNGKKAIVVETSDLPNSISSGVYLFRVESGSDMIFGKFAIGKD